MGSVPRAGAVPREASPMERDSALILHQEMPSRQVQEGVLIHFPWEQALPGQSMDFFHPIDVPGSDPCVDISLHN